LAEWSLIDREEAEDIQTRYHQPAFADDVLREVFRSDRCLSPQAAVMELPVAPTAFPAAPTQSFPMRTACQAAQGSRSDGENDARSLLGDRPTDQALRASSARPAKRLTFAAGRQRAGEYCAVDGTRVRLAVNAGASWLASDWALAPPRHAAEVVVLSSCRDAQHTRPAEAATETVQVTGTEPPNCRGPPPLDQRRLTRRVVAKAGHAAPSAMVSDVDLVVLDNLGHPVPICAAELDAIETYLGDVLEEVFASSKAGSEAKST
jgi:hypothetical protein